MKQILKLSCVLWFSCCSIIKPPKVVGTYKSTCTLYGFPDLIVIFNSDSTFVYKMPYVEEFTGTWVLERDRLILYSSKFSTQSPSESTPAYKYNKYTELEGKDVYLVRGKRLLVVTNAGFSKNCYLQKGNTYELH